jgi:ubiquinone biosynthesis monooxygenase Coq7
MDELIIGFDKAISVFNSGNKRPNPAVDEPDARMQGADRRRSAALMRVNHAGEVAAQALYAGHAIAARDAGVRASMLQAAAEESDHLYWCETRVRELGSHVSYLTPVWYAGSFAIGAVAGLSGDKWNLGFVMETERQVVEHLDKHLELLPEQDHKSRAVLQQMRRDEQQHASVAQAAGAVELPRPLKIMMRCCAKVMTGTAYWL